MDNIFTEYRTLVSLRDATLNAMEDSKESSEDVFSDNHNFIDAFILLGKLNKKIRRLKVRMDEIRKAVCKRCLNDNKEGCLFFNDSVNMYLRDGMYSTSCLRRYK